MDTDRQQVTQPVRSTLKKKSVLIVTAIGLFLVLALSCGDPSPLRFYIRVEDFDGLAAGQPVLYEEVEIGRVTRIQLSDSAGATIGVEILPEHRDSVYREMRFLILQDSKEGAVLVVEDREGRKTAIEDGSVIEVRPGWRELLARRIEELGTAARGAIQDLGGAVDDVIETWETSPEAKAFRKSLAEIGQDVKTVARSRYRRFVEEELPELEVKARAYRDKLEKQGRQKEAEIFWKWFDRWAEALKSAAHEEAADGESGEALKVEEEPPPGN